MRENAMLQIIFYDQGDLFKFVEMGFFHLQLTKMNVFLIKSLKHYIFSHVTKAFRKNRGFLCFSMNFHIGVLNYILTMFKIETSILFTVHTKINMFDGSPYTTLRFSAMLFI